MQTLLDLLVKKHFYFIHRLRTTFPKQIIALLTWILGVKHCCKIISCKHIKDYNLTVLHGLTCYLWISFVPIWRALKNRGIPQKLISTIQEMYRETSCSVLHNGQTSEYLNQTQELDKVALSLHSCSTSCWTGF